MWGIDDEDGSCWLGGVLVDEAHQGRGVGRAAVVEALRTLRHAGRRRGVRAVLPARQPRGEGALREPGVRRDRRGRRRRGRRPAVAGPDDGAADGGVAGWCRRPSAPREDPQCAPCSTSSGSSSAASGSPWATRWPGWSSASSSSPSRSASRRSGWRATPCGRSGGRSCPRRAPAPARWSSTSCGSCSPAGGWPCCTSSTAVAQAITIIGIPLAVANLKMVPISLVPYGKQIVRTDSLPPGQRPVHSL